MSVISTGEPTPNRIEIVARAVATRGEAGIPADELRRRISPAPLQRGGQTQHERDAESQLVARVLSEALALGLVWRDAQDRYYPGDGLPAEGADSFRAHLAAILLDPGRAERAGQEHVPRALAWFLEQDPTRPVRFTGDDVPERIKREYGEDVDSFGLTNENPRWHQFTYWACYLGYAWRLSYSPTSEFVVADPTEALERILAPLLHERGELPIRDARAAWATASPVLDGGAVRSELYELRTKRPPDDRTPLSASTSLALRRLEERGLMRLHEASNAPTLLLTLGGRTQPVSHLVPAGRS